MKKQLILLFLLLTTFGARAYDFEVDGMYYNILSANTCGVTFKAYTVNDNPFDLTFEEEPISTYAGNVVVPSQVTNDKTTYTVTEIQTFAFYKCYQLTSVTLPNTVTKIADYAFYNCSALASVQMSNAVTVIDDFAFRGCASLTAIDLPNTLAEIGDFAFAGCTQLEAVEIPCSVTSIGNGAFNKLQRLTYNAIQCSTEAPSYCRSERSEAQRIPNVVSRDPIFSAALQQVTIGDQVQMLPSYLFKYCTGLTSITIPASVTEIGMETFYSCTGLTEIISLNTTPPAPNVRTFQGVDTSNCLLVVPSQSIEAYKAVYSWRQFKNMKGIEVDENNTLGLFDPDALYTLGTERGYLPPSEKLTAFQGHKDYQYIFSVRYIGVAGRFRITGEQGNYQLYNADVEKYLSADGTPTTAYVSEPDGTFSILPAKEVDEERGEEGKWIIKSNVTGKWLMFGGEDQFLNNDDWATVDAGDMWTINPFDPNRKEDDNHVIYYTAPKMGNAVTPSNTDAFGANIIWNEKEIGEEEGRIIFDGDVTMIGQEAFKNSSLISVKIPASVTSIGSQAFYFCTNLTSVNIPEGVTEIGRSAFTRCKRLTSIEIPEAVTTIGATAFSNTGLTEITSHNTTPPTVDGSNVFNGVDKDACILYVPAEAVEAYKAAEGWSEFPNIVAIGSEVILDEDVNYLQYEYLDDTQSAWKVTGYTNEIPANAIIPATHQGLPVMEIGYWALQDCETLETITIPSSITSIGGNPFLHCVNLKEIVVEDNPNFFFESDCLIDIYGTLITGLNKPSIVIPNSVTHINNSAFNGCIDMESVVIPESVLYINVGAFERCTSLTSVDIPNSVKTIDAYAFENCSSLKSVTIPASVEQIDSNPFYACPELSEISVENNPNFFFENDCLIDASGKLITGLNKSTIVIPNSVKTIGWWACKDTQLTSVELPESLTEIQGLSFGDCYSLQTIISRATTPPTLDCGEWSDSFARAHKEQIKVMVPAEAVEAYKAAEGWSEFPNIVAIEDDEPKLFSPDKLYTLGTARGYLPKGENLTEVKTYYYIVSVDSEASAGRFRITGTTDNYTIYNTNIGKYLSANGTPTSAYVSESNGTFSILPAQEADSARGEEGKWIIKSNVTGKWMMFGGDYQFLNNDGWKQADAGDMWTIEEATATETPVGENSVILYTSSDGNIVTPRSNGAFGASILSNTYEDGQGKIVFEGSITRIGNDAFSQRNKLTSIVLPETVTEIGNNAFHSCTALTSITFPSELTKIGEYVFIGCGMTSLELPNSLQSIGQYAFCRCWNLTSVEIPNSVEDIQESSFVVCPSLESFSGKYASEDNRCLIVDGTLISFAPVGLTTYAIPGTVTRIGNGVFDSCTGLTSIEIPASVTQIGQWSFGDCTGLQELISLSATPPTVNANTFNNVDRSTCVVKVPAEAVDDYKAADVWQTFTNIVALTDEEMLALGIVAPAPALQPATGVTYDLSGRKVGNKPQRGITIRDGRKYISK